MYAFLDSTEEMEMVSLRIRIQGQSQLLTECEFRPGLYGLKNNTKQNDVFQCALLMPLYIYICKPSEVHLFVTYVG